MIQEPPQLIKEKEINKIYKGIVDKDDLDNYIYFSIILPFHIGFPEKHCITIKDAEDNKTLSFIFQTYKYILNKEEHITSSVNMLLFDKKLKNTKENLNNSLSNTFDCLLEQLNIIIFSYKYVTKIPFLYEINVTDIDSMVFYGVKVGGMRLKPLGLFLLDISNFKMKQRILNKEEFNDFTEIHHMTVNKLNPLCDVKRMGLDAYSLGVKRKYSEAILMKQITFERLLYEIFKIVYPEKNEEDYNNIPFKKMITRYMPEKLGGNWNIIEGSEKVVSRYFNGFYKLRCKIVHNGYKPSVDEYRKASEENEEILKFITERIKIKKKQYPKLFKMFSDN